MSKEFGVCRNRDARGFKWAVTWDGCDEGRDRHWMFQDVALWRRVLCVPLCVALHVIVVLVEWLKP